MSERGPTKSTDSPVLLVLSAAFVIGYIIHRPPEPVLLAPDLDGQEEAAGNGGLL